MADLGRMTIEELASKVLADEHGDWLRAAVAFLADALMEAEVEGVCGAAYRERSPERVNQRNGYRARAFKTRVGEIELQIPKLRQGSYFPGFLEPRKVSQQALVACVQEAYVNGVSTRKVDRLVEALGLAGISKDQVSRLCRALGERVAAFRDRPVEGAYPYLWLDAKVEKGPRGWPRATQGAGRRLRCAREGDPGGARDRRRPGRDGGVLARVPAGLVKRGLAGVQLVVSDAHEGLKAAIGQVLGCPWQRCPVHFLREALGHCPKEPDGRAGAVGLPGGREGWAARLPRRVVRRLRRPDDEPARVFVADVVRQADRLDVPVFTDGSRDAAITATLTGTLIAELSNRAPTLRCTWSSASAVTLDSSEPTPLRGGHVRPTLYAFPA
jgi:putative transposase